jgi:DNA modification methylase
LGEFQGYTFAIPDTDVDIGPEEAAAELNIYRENLTGADRTTYLNWLIKSQIIDSEEFHVARDVNTTELLSQLEDSREWEYSEEAKAELEELLSVMDFESPEDARNHISLYNRAPESVQELWILDEINYSHFEELTRISEHLEQGADLADTSVRSGHSFEDLIEYSREDDYRGQDEYYTRNELRDIVEELDRVLEQDQKEKNLFDAIGADKEQRDRIQGIADEWGTSTENFVKNNLLDKEGADTEDIEEIDNDELNERLEREEEKVSSDPSWFEQATNRSLQGRENKREQDLTNFSDTDWKSSYAGPGEYHRAPPFVEENVQVFFHDSANTGDSSSYSGSMDDEISNESVDLFFFSPPYYVQRGTIDSYDSYDDYLDDMQKVFSSVYEKLKPHRYFLLNISDHTTTGGQDNESGKRLPIQSDVSSMISREIGFEYEGTIRWYKPNPTSSQRASHYFENENTKGQPLYYYPEDRIEEIFIFRKGERHQEAVYTEAMERFDDQFNNLETFRETVARDNPKEAFQRAFTEKVDLDKFSGIYKTDLWPIVPTASNEGITTHTAGFPKRLAKLVVQLYSLPGDRIADPMVGFGSTLAAVQDLNQESEFDVHREGLGWESFKGEQEDQPDYYEVIQRMLGTTGIDQFLSPA